MSNAVEWVIDHFAELDVLGRRDPGQRVDRARRARGLGWSTTPAERAFLAVAASAFVLVVVEVGIFASRFALRIEERNMFCVAPLLFLAFSLWLARGMPRPLVLTAVAAWRRRLSPRPALGGCSTSASSPTPSAHPAAPARAAVNRVDTVVLMLAGGIAAALAFALLPRARPRRPAAGVALFLVLASVSVHGAIRDHSRATLALTDPTEPSWIDERIGSSAKAAYLYGAAETCRRGADPLADGVLEPERRRTSTGSARRSPRRCRRASRASTGRQDASRWSRPRRIRSGTPSFRLRPARRRAPGQDTAACALQGRAADAVHDAAGGGLRGRLDDQRRRLHPVRHVDGRAGPTTSPRLA